MEHAKRDFLAHQGSTGFDAASEELPGRPRLDFPKLREFRGCSVRSGRVFEQLSVSPEVEYWAIEVEFTGTDTETGLEEEGRAILLYRAFRQVGEDERLIGIFPGTTAEEIGMIEGGTKASFEFLRQQADPRPR